MSEKIEYYGMFSDGSVFKLLNDKSRYEFKKLNEFVAYCPVCRIDYILYAARNRDVSNQIYCPHCAHHINFKDVEEIEGFKERIELRESTT